MLIVLLLNLIVSFAHGEPGERPPPQTAKIQDNSFLIEEAYNQEPGVIQHIQSFQYLNNESWQYSFTEEWPVLNQTHQLSVTVPIIRPGTDSDPNSGLGDVALNYRYQVYLRGPLAFAPRLSLLLPTGDYEKGLGLGAPGAQTNLPLSRELSESFVTHWNLGVTYTPSARAAGGARANVHTFNYGAGLIWLASPVFNPMLEIYGLSAESINDDSSLHRTHDLYLNPGIRGAVNFRSGLQIVPGLSIPIGIGDSKGSYGILIYLSFEHPSRFL